MTRDLAAVATIDDRRHCPISAVSNVVDVSSIANSIVTSSSSSNGDIGGGGDDGSLKSSSAISTSTSCCSGSDDDSSTITRLSTVFDDNCPTTIKTLPLQVLNKEVDKNIGDINYSNCTNSNNIANTSKNIEGRLTFYKDGKFIFQLAAHNQQHESSKTSPCRWVPVPTVIQQNKNSVKSMNQWSQLNKIIWPYLVTNNISDNKSKSSNPIQTSLSLAPITTNTVNVSSIGSVVVTTSNIFRKPSRKCSTIASEYNNCWQLQSQLSSVSRRSQHQHQSFMMVATDAIKALRRLKSSPRYKRHYSRRSKTTTDKKSLLMEQAPINLECIVRNLWCQQHTKELIMRKHLLLNNSVDITGTSASRRVGVPSSNFDSMISNTGSGKRRSIFSLLHSTAEEILPATTITMATSSLSIKGSNSNSRNSNSNNNDSPHKKYRLQQQQQQRRTVSNNDTKDTTVLQLPTTNDHSITAILSGGAVGSKRFASSLVNSKNCVTTSNSGTVITHKNHLSQSPAPLSLLRTLLKSPVGDSNVQPNLVNAGNNGYNFYNAGGGSRKRLAIESTNAPLIHDIKSSLANASGTAVIGTTIKNINKTSSMVIPTKSAVISGNTAVNNNGLTENHQLPLLNHPVTTSTAAAAAAAKQLTAARYFNVLYHQAAMAAAIAYQNSTQVPQPLQKPIFPTAVVNDESLLRQMNRRPLVHPSESVVGPTGINPTSPTSPIVAPFSTSLSTTAIDGISLLPPTTSSSMSQPVDIHSLLLNHQQYHQQEPYHPVATIQQQQPFSYQHKQRQHLNIVKRKTDMMEIAEYSTRDENNLSRDKEASSTDCMPLNLSKDSVAANVDSSSTTATVR